MQYDEIELIKGIHTGIDVWVCAYHWKDYSNSKPIRNQPPTKCALTYIDITGRFQYAYRNMNFTSYDKKGELSNKNINFADNTTSSKNNLLVFDNEKDCLDAYIDLIKKSKEELKNYLDSTVNYINDKIESLDKIVNKWAHE